MGEPSFYAHPRLYDLLQGGDTREEADLLERLHAEHGNGGMEWLEPACGTGRLAVELGRRGWSVTGYDISARMLAYARRRGARVLRGDLRTFRRPRGFDFAYSLQGTLRHLQSDREALAHLRATAASLRPGGLYAVGLDLTDYRLPEDDEETWEARDGRRVVRQVQLTLPAERKPRRERVLQFVASGPRLLKAHYDLRTYDAAEWRGLIRRSPFRLAAVYDLWGKLSTLDRRTRAATFLLRLL